MRKRLLRKSYTVTNVLEARECDMSDVQSLTKYVRQIYIPSVIDVFSKCLNLVPVKTKICPSVALAFPSIFHDEE